MNMRYLHASQHESKAQSDSFLIPVLVERHLRECRFLFSFFFGP